MSDLIEVSPNLTDLFDKPSENEDLLYRYAEHLYKHPDYRDSGYDEPMDVLSNLLNVERVDNPTFIDLLEQWYAYKGKNLEDEVRGYYSIPSSRSFLMTHGVGYEWVSADLLGGNATGDAKREFNDWLRGKGFYIERYCE